MDGVVSPRLGRLRPSTRAPRWEPGKACLLLHGIARRRADPSVRSGCRALWGLITVGVGTCAVHRSDVDEAIEVVAYRPEWADQGLALTRQIWRSLGTGVADVQHIGSTAVPGLAAKPVLDVGVALAKARWPSAARLLEGLGFTDLGAAGVEGRRYLRRRDRLPSANVHLLEPDQSLWSDNLLLRDYLRANPSAALRYETRKRDAARCYPTLLSYSAAKDEVVRELVAEARASFEGPRDVPRRC
ncbi:GrpB family protein [Microlunatus flavus]|uniref:GrpB family protein n=1 Tax=Microlunatus flavus TaxID=1036181 RepID=UPI002FC82295